MRGYESPSVTDSSGDSSHACLLHLFVYKHELRIGCVFLSTCLSEDNSPLSSCVFVCTGGVAEYVLRSPGLYSLSSACE